jgi:serine O-acetyltransferase
MAPLPISSWRTSRNSWKAGLRKDSFVQEHLKNRDQIRHVTREVLQTFGTLQPKLEHLASTPLPNKASVIQILDDLLEVIYPGYFGRKYVESSNIEYHIGDLIDSVYSRLTQEIYRGVRNQCQIAADICEHCQDTAEEQAMVLLRKIAELRSRLSQDVQAAYDGDPAAKSIDEVIFAYPAIFAVTVFRIAHELNVQGIPLLPRMMTEHAHTVTGIDIHPGATIGSGFFIDHGTGVVIGETTIIGNRVKLYQGVTLGALSFAMDEEGQLIRGKKRHPTIEDEVVIYAGATILGGNTVIGRGSVIGGNAWLTRSVPPFTKLFGQKREDND